MVFEEVRVFFEVNVFQRQFAKPLAAVGVGCRLRGDTTATKLGACTILGICVNIACYFTNDR